MAEHRGYETSWHMIGETVMVPAVAPLPRSLP